MSNDTDFAERFKVLSGYDPFPWQVNLYNRFIVEDLPVSCSLPTGVGKTSVIAVWLIARATGANVARRLVYVVNRRTVVDQTTDEAIKLRNNAPKIGIDDLAISTLRGQFAYNQEWSSDPSRPAIICGTVDRSVRGCCSEGTESDLRVDRCMLVSSDRTPYWSTTKLTSNRHSRG